MEIRNMLLTINITQKICIWPYDSRIEVFVNYTECVADVVFSHMVATDISNTNV